MIYLIDNLLFLKIYLYICTFYKYDCFRPSATILMLFVSCYCFYFLNSEKHLANNKYY